MKILAISHNSFSKVFNNGKTLESLFSGIEKDDLAQLYFVEDKTIDFDFCWNYYKITDKNVLKNLIRVSGKCGGVITDIHSGGGDKKESIGIHNKARKFSKYLTLARDILWQSKSWNTKDLRNWCKEFNPDVIFFVGGLAGFSHTIARYIATLLNKPLVAYFTDDYIIYPKNRTILDFIQCSKMKRSYRKTINQSSLLFTIGDMMSEEYTKYFGKQFYPIMNSVPIEKYISYTANSKLRISYFGGLHLNRWKMIVKLAKILGEGNLNIYTVNKPSEDIMNEFNAVGVQYCGYVEGEEMRKAMLNSDILLHVESDDIYYKSLTRLSVSTKIPEYLMSGRLVLGYGPSEVASMRLISENNIGIVIPCSASDIEINKKLSDIMTNYEIRKEIGIKGYEYAVKHFENTKIASDFISKIKSIIKNNN